MWKLAIVREITLVLLIKLGALWLIWFTFFNQPNIQPKTQQDVSHMLLGNFQSTGDTPISSQ